MWILFQKRFTRSDVYLSLVRERTKRTWNRTIFREFSHSNSFVSLLFWSEASTLSFVWLRDSIVLPFAAPDRLISFSVKTLFSFFFSFNFYWILHSVTILTLHGIAWYYITINYKYITLHYTMNFNGKVTIQKKEKTF